MSKRRFRFGDAYNGTEGLSSRDRVAAQAARLFGIPRRYVALRSEVEVLNEWAAVIEGLNK